MTEYAIYQLDEQGRVTTWNTVAQKINGSTEAEMIGEHHSRFFPPEDVEPGKPQNCLDAARAAGRYEEQGWRVRKDGSRFWADMVITAQHDATGEVVGFADVTRI